MEYLGSKEEVVADVTGAWMLGGGCAYFGNVLYSSVSGGASIQVGYTVHVPTHQ